MMEGEGVDADDAGGRGYCQAKGPSYQHQLQSPLVVLCRIVACAARRRRDADSSSYPPCFACHRYCKLLMLPLVFCCSFCPRFEIIEMEKCCDQTAVLLATQPDATNSIRLNPLERPRQIGTRQSFSMVVDSPFDASGLFDVLIRSRTKLVGTIVSC